MKKIRWIGASVVFGGALLFALGRFSTPLSAFQDSATQMLSIEYFAPEPACLNDGGGLMAYVKNSDPPQTPVRYINAVINKTTILVTGGPQPPQNIYPHPLVAGGSRAPLGCTSHIDLTDINNPRTYVIRYEVVSGTFYQELLPPPGTSCPNTPSAVGNCASSPITAGYYRLRSRINFWRDGHPLPLCVDIRTQDGRFQQLDCRGVDEQSFYINGPDAQGCYTLRTSSNLLVRIQKNDDTKSDIDAIAASQIPPNCAFLTDKTRWQIAPIEGIPSAYRIKNKARGLCFDVDGNSVGPTGIVQGLDCRSVEPWANQDWYLDRLR